MVTGDIPVSVITVVLNGERTLPRTIGSVLAQDYDDLEYIIIDGGSKDRSVQIAERYRKSFEEKGIRYRIISEPDRGMFHALNKGIRMAGGMLVGNINSDDWYEPDAVRTMAELYRRERYDAAWGNILLHGMGKPVLKRARIGKVKTSRHFCHPAMFSLRDVLLEYPYACIGTDDDLDLMLRLSRGGKKLLTVDRVIAHYSMGGMSFCENAQELRQRISQHYATYRRNGYSRLYLAYCGLNETVKYLVNVFGLVARDSDRTCSSPMKVLYINSHYGQGGAARIASGIFEKALDAGYTARYYYGRGERQMHPQAARLESPAEIWASALFSRLSGLNGWGNHSATMRLIREIRKEKPDVIHLHTLHGYYLHMGMLFGFLKKAGIPVVWTFHDCHAFTGNCGYFFACRRWQKGCGACPYLHRYPSSWFLDLTRYMWKKKREWSLAVKPDVIVTPSAWMKRQVERSFFKDIPCSVVHNGIDTGTFYPRDRQYCRKKHGFREEDHILLGVAMDFSDPRKGLKYILKAAGMQERDADLRLLLVGNGRWQRVSLKNEHPFTPPRKNCDDLNLLAEYYSLADVFLLPSTAENYATTALEAMACGTPVAGFDVGGTREIVTRGCGILVRPGDTKALADAVRQVLDGNGILNREDIAARIRQENSMERMWEGYREIYETVCGAASPEEEGRS